MLEAWPNCPNEAAQIIIELEAVFRHAQRRGGVNELDALGIDHRYHAHVRNDARTRRSPKEQKIARPQLGRLDGLAPGRLLVAGARNVDARIGKRELEQGRAVHA
nr:hypothetical protein [Tanacetum cinerariifolium]